MESCEREGWESESECESERKRVQRARASVKKKIENWNLKLIFGSFQNYASFWNQFSVFYKLKIIISYQHIFNFMKTENEIIIKRTLKKRLGFVKRCTYHWPAGDLGLSKLAVLGVAAYKMRLNFEILEVNKFVLNNWQTSGKKSWLIFYFVLFLVSYYSCINDKKINWNHVEEY